MWDREGERLGDKETRRQGDRENFRMAVKDPQVMRLGIRLSWWGA